MKNSNRFFLILAFIFYAVNLVWSVLYKQPLYQFINPIFLLWFSMAVYFYLKPSNVAWFGRKLEKEHEANRVVSHVLSFIGAALFIVVNLDFVFYFFNSK